MKKFYFEASYSLRNDALQECYTNYSVIPCQFQYQITSSLPRNRRLLNVLVFILIRKGICSFRVLCKWKALTSPVIIHWYKHTVWHLFGNFVCPLVSIPCGNCDTYVLHQITCYKLSSKIIIRLMFVYIFILPVAFLRVLEICKK